MKLEHLINREPIAVETVASGDTIENVQICPVGDFPNGGREQRCSLKAFENVVNRWKAQGSKEILVDFEHKCEEGGTADTSAAAWATNLRVEKNRGLVADFKVTDLGAEALSNRRLRFLSVAWLVNKTTREPTEITSIALTNKPNIPVAPVLNRENAGGINVEEETKGPTMDKLKEALGLSADATEDQILAAVQEALKAKEEVAQLKANAEKAKLEAEAEEFAEKNKAKCDKAVLKAQFIANKEVAQALVAGIPAAKVEPVCNKAEAKKPTSFEANKAESDEAILNKYESLSGKAKAEYLEAHALEINRARNAK